MAVAPTFEPATPPTDGDIFGALKGRSKPVQQLRCIIQRVAPTNASVFLQGESGTGKELIAQTIHDLSNRRDSVFVAVNCGALPLHLIESELFGHERGSFTGASRQHKGYFERAAGGTLFLDEVTEMPVELQVTLLRAIETGRITRLGGTSEVLVNFRIIAAANRRPADAIAAGQFREDLYFRLATFPIHVPPLRERAGDIHLLAQHFLDLLNRADGVNKSLSTDALEMLESHSWPGNVRELKNALQRAYILADEIIGPEHFPTYSLPLVPSAPGDVPIGATIDDMERRLIFATLAHFKGDKRRAAKALGISLKTVYNRLKRYEQEETIDRSATTDRCHNSNHLLLVC